MSDRSTAPARHAFPLRIAAPLIRYLTLWQARHADRAHIRRLLSRNDDHLIDDMGMTRDSLRKSFGLWDQT